MLNRWTHWPARSWSEGAREQGTLLSSLLEERDHQQGQTRLTVNFIKRWRLWQWWSSWNVLYGRIRNSVYWLSSGSIETVFLNQSIACMSLSLYYVHRSQCCYSFNWICANDGGAVEIILVHCHNLFNLIIYCDLPWLVCRYYVIHERA
jgi:hypothetical protein